jgi:hypothetical protein
MVWGYFTWAFRRKYNLTNYPDESQLHPSNCASCHIGDRLNKVVSSRPTAKAYFLKNQNCKVEETLLNHK